MADWITTYRYAHRGLHDAKSDLPENSLAAFRAAATHGYGIELDVQRAACGTPVVFHDFTLDRMTGETGYVHTQTAASLSTLPLAGTGEKIPLLADLLAEIGGRVPLLIELKIAPRQRIGPLEQAVAHLLDAYHGPVAVQSFTPESVGWFAEMAPEFIRGQIAADFIRRPDRGMSWQDRLDWTKLWRSDVSQPHFVSYHVRDLPNPASRAVRRAGIPLICWTVRSEDQRALAENHADSYIFEGFTPDPMFGNRNRAKLNL
ncbi:MAG TPA: glycerophosphodiester phosphodiesterase [Alphaproteobacteria bacterium]|nr:glycerophosphodiester phosphodiesterase [Alphaproteobacteria bacterium]